MNDIQPIIYKSMTYIILHMYQDVASKAGLFKARNREFSQKRITSAFCFRPWETTVPRMLEG